MLAEENSRKYIEYLQNQEDQYFEGQQFADVYGYLSLYKQVRTYKSIKNELFAWGQLIDIISIFIMIVSVLVLIFNALSIFLRSFPFVLILSVDNNTTRRFYPDKYDNTLVYGFILHLLGLIQCLLGFGMGLSMQFMRKWKDIEMCK